MLCPNNKVFPEAMNSDDMQNKWNCSLLVLILSFGSGVQHLNPWWALFNSWPMGHCGATNYYFTINYLPQFSCTYFQQLAYAEYDCFLFSLPLLTSNPDSATSQVMMKNTWIFSVSHHNHQKRGGRAVLQIPSSYEMDTSNKLVVPFSPVYKLKFWMINTSDVTSLRFQYPILNL